MALYTYKCPNPGCQKVVEKIAKLSDRVLCDCVCEGFDDIGRTELVHPVMKIVPSVPSPMQWGHGCKWN